MMDERQFYSVLDDWRERRQSLESVSAKSWSVSEPLEDSSNL